MGTEPLVAFRTSLPCAVPQGGAAVVLVDGRLMPDSVQGPGDLSPGPWREHGRRVEAVVLPLVSLRLAFEVTDLVSHDGCQLDLTVELALRISDPRRFVVDLVRDAPRFDQAELVEWLRGTVRTALFPAVSARPLNEIYADGDLRGWLGVAVEVGLRDESDLSGRSGLTVTGVDAFDIRCLIWNELQKARETWYFRAALSEMEAQGRMVLDERALSTIQKRLSVKAQLVKWKENLADLLDREDAVDDRIKAAEQARERRQKLIDSLGRPPSLSRPERWRRALEERVHTAPLCDGRRVYVVTARGVVTAFATIDGQPRWPRSCDLGAAPADGMALAGGYLWIPGHDGVLYGLEPAGGAVVHRIPIGGRLSSGPLVAEDVLYLGVDVDNSQSQRPGHGNLVAVDALSGKVLSRWQVSVRGFRATPARGGPFIFLGDRSGKLFALDVRRGQIEDRPLERAGRLLGGILVDAAQGQIVFGDSYGRLLALDWVGRQRWPREVRLGGPLGSSIVGRPLLHRQTVFVGVGDGRVHALRPTDGQPVWPAFQTNGPVATGPVAWDDFIFVGSNDGYLYALEAGSGECFWRYYSGSPIHVPPAVDAEGNLYVVDSAGHLSALRWCLGRYPEAARRCAEARPPRLAEAAQLWLLAGDKGAAMEAAEQAGRLDIVAELAADMDWYTKAAEACETVAGQQGDKARAAAWWARAGLNWRLAGRLEAERRCRLHDAQARGVPLLSLRLVRPPVLVLGTADAAQVRVTNESGVLARDVVVSWEGDVVDATKKPLGSLGPSETSSLVDIAVLRSQPGLATLSVTASCYGPQGSTREVASLEERFQVGAPSSVHHHYHGPTAQIAGDGVIVMRHGEGGSSHTLRVQSGEDRVEVERSGDKPFGDEIACRFCGAPAEAGDNWCPRCGEPLNDPA